MGCLVALTLALKAPGLVSELVLLGPPPTQLPEAGQKVLIARAATARASGMAAVVDAIVSVGTSTKSKTDNPIGIAAVRMSTIVTGSRGIRKRVHSTC